jgi:hypothetical protein
MEVAGVVEERAPLSPEALLEEYLCLLVLVLMVALQELLRRL